MDELIYIFSFAALLAGGLAAIAVSAPRPLMVKVMALGLAAAVLPLSYASFVSLLSRPKPVSFEWLRAGATDASILGAAVREGEGIYLLLALPGVAEPRYYRLPWSREMAQQLQDAQAEAEQNGGGLNMRQPFARNSIPGERRFYPRPQPAMPPKSYGSPPMEYIQPGSDV